MIAYFPDDEIVKIPFGSGIKDLINEEGQKPYAIILNRQEVITILTDTDRTRRQNYAKYITETLYNAVENPKEINLTIA